ncbi:MAG: diguanylate cyclase [Rhodoferax sp.]
MKVCKFVKKTKTPSLALPLEPEPALQAALAVNKELNELLDAADVAAILIDRQMRILRFTQTAAQLLNLNPGDVGRPLGPLLSRLLSDDPPVADIHAMLDTLGPLDAQVQTTAGLCFKLRIRPQQESNNIIEGAIITLVDITEMKRMEKALLDGEERYRSMVEWSPEAINMLRDGKFIYVNSAAIELYGATSAQDLLGKPSRDRIHPDDLESALVRMKSLTLHGVSAPLVEMTFFKLDGSAIKVQAQAKLVEFEGAPAVHVAWRDISERKRAQDALRESVQRTEMADEVLHLAFHDALTNLPNRRVLVDRIGQAMIASKRSGCYGALMFIDLDNFKTLNDTHGHAVGDQLLIEVAQRLRNSVREADTVARFGGDEFVVVFSPLKSDKADSGSQAKIIAQNISATLSQPYRLTTRHEGGIQSCVEHVCTASIGVTLLFSHEASHDDILKWADMAMYQAKKSGRNAIRFHELSA